MLHIIEQGERDGGWQHCDRGRRAGGGARRRAGARRAHPRGAGRRGHGAAGPERLGQDHPDALRRRHPAHHRRAGARAGAAGRRQGPAGEHRLPDPEPVGLRRPHRAREPALLRPRARGAAHPRRPLHRHRRRRRDRGPPGREALGRPARPRLAGRRVARRARAAGARRADRRARPGAPPRPVGAVPRARRGRCHGAGLEPRDGRGQALRRAGAAARRQAAGDRHAGRHPGPRRGATPGGRLPAPDRAGAGRRRRCPVSARITLATAVRVLTQLRHDPRTVLLLLLGVPCLLMTTLHERVSGTLERLLAMPTRKLDLLLGYAIAFGAAALVQASIASWLALGPLGLDVAGGAVPLLGVAILDGLLGMALGLFVSAFAATEFQAAQFMPAFVLPLTYAVDAMQRVSAAPDLTTTVWRDLAVLAGSCALALLLGAATLRRR